MHSGSFGFIPYSITNPLKTEKLDMNRNARIIIYRRYPLSRYRRVRFFPQSLALLYLKSKIQGTQISMSACLFIINSTPHPVFFSYNIRFSLPCDICSVIPSTKFTSAPKRPRLLHRRISDAACKYRKSTSVHIWCSDRCV